MGTVGVEGTYLLGAVLCAVAIFLMASMQGREVPTAGFHRNLFVDTLGGLRLAVAERFLLVVLVATIIFIFFGSA